MECYKLRGDESPEEMEEIFAQVYQDFLEFGTVSIFEKIKYN